MKLIIRNLFLLAVGGFTLFVIVACEPNKKPLPSANKATSNNYPIWLSGTWDGELFYHHIEKSLKVSLSFKSGKNRLRYHEKNCTSDVVIELSKNIGISLKEVTIKGDCSKFGKITLTPYKNEKAVKNKDIFEVSNVDTIYLQYPKLSEKDELLSGWLIKKKIRH